METRKTTHCVDLIQLFGKTGGGNRRNFRLVNGKTVVVWTGSPAHTGGCCSIEFVGKAQCVGVADIWTAEPRCRKRPMGVSLSMKYPGGSDRSTVAGTSRGAAKSRSHRPVWASETRTSQLPPSHARHRSAASTPSAARYPECGSGRASGRLRADVDLSARAAGVHRRYERSPPDQRPPSPAAADVHPIRRRCAHRRRTWLPPITVFVPA